MPTVSVVQILTASIAPVIVISGVGLLLLSITNRCGRVIDRARLPVRDLAESDRKAPVAGTSTTSFASPTGGHTCCAVPCSTPEPAFSLCR